MLDSISDILESIDTISFDEFENNKEKHSAIIRWLEIIGEAAKNVSEQTKLKYPDIPWKQIAGTRDRLIHGYFTVDLDIVWNICTKDIVPIKKKLEKIFEECENNTSV